ncbi:hypothetical protein N0V90_012679 [Kalmusia sp. IMI 367209]|nr:hypothetical protein N0V90_012679 [Kalmusia sp. IMI 367209]
MASITCTINIKNKWNDAKFFLFQDLPVPDNAPSGKVYTNVFQVSPKVDAARDGSSTLSFRMPNTFYAIYGTSSGEKDDGTPGPKTVVATSSFRKIKLGPNGSVIKITAVNGGIEWDDAAVQGQKCADQSGFQFLTDKSIPGTGNPNLYIGVGAPDPKDAENVIPIQSYKAESSLTSKLYPKLTYYVATGDFEPGQMVDRTKVGEWVKIDFEGAKTPTAFVVLQEDGTWVDDKLKSKNNSVSIESSS